MLAFSDKDMPGSVKFKRITYIEMLKFLWACARHKDGRYFTEKRWCDPVYIDVHNLTRHDNAAFRDYVLWCEGNLGRFRSFTATEKRTPFYSVLIAISTNFWTSFVAFFSTIATVIIAFSCLYIFMKHGFLFPSEENKYFDLVEYSFKTFVNAGFSDVKPSNSTTRILTMIEATLGYVSLGALVFLLNKRIESMRSN
ncbi:hypothetical protein UB46_23455 [Burkholderiaceae bacterium 16]|nr:hypothetical protein UB46_23455 [Burkholderiaceae bacterium 16]